MIKPMSVGQLTRLIRDVKRWADLREERKLSAITLRECQQCLEEYRSIVVVHRNQQHQHRKAV